MKRITLKTLLFLFVATLTAGIFGVRANTVYANNEAQLNTVFYLPSSPIEFYDLTAPVGITYNNGNYAFSEYYDDKEDNKNDVNSIIVYNSTTKSYVKVFDDSSIKNISNVALYNNFLFYVSGSEIYYIDINNITKKPVNTGVFSSTYISVNENVIITNTNNSIKVYELSTFDGAPVFTFRYSIMAESFIGYIDGGKNIYYQNANGFYYYSIETSTIYEIFKGENKSAISITDIGNNLYYTTTDGLYELEKGENKTPKLLLGVDKTSNSLGFLNSPQGVTSKDGKLLISDNKLNCIQEFDVQLNCFTNFAITTEATANYRLTSDASNISLSENYIYVLDKTTLDNSQNAKRLLKKSIENVNEYERIDLSFLYKDNDNYQIEKIVCSNEHVLIYDGTNLTLYKQTENSLESIYTVKNEAITSISYLDGNFYYTHTAKSPELTHDYTKVYQISLPNEANNLEALEVQQLTSGEEIKGIVNSMTVDVFGNVYLLYKDSSEATQYKLARYYANTLNSITTLSLNANPIKINCDFAGNVYLLLENNKVVKYVLNSQNTAYEATSYSINLAGGTTVKDFCLSYKSDSVYYLSNACILKNEDNLLNVSNLNLISAENVNEKAILNDVSFLTLKKNAKIFKIELDNYKEIDGKKYFNNITPITELNTSKCYPIISEIDSDYYLISYSGSVLALVRKTSVSQTLTSGADASIIDKNSYSSYGITETQYNGEEMFISNTEYVFAKPIYNSSYLLYSIEKGTKIYLIKEYCFNNTKYTLISLSKNGEPYGYVPSGYLTNSVDYKNEPYLTTTNKIGENSQKSVTDALMIMLIGLTITLTALFIEYKLLFKSGK
ncbi:MAG: hypothetical protein IKV61_05260 [Clostridia bacterium]|nr:hypothetical protein [Clostridia bacterium]